MQVRSICPPLGLHRSNATHSESEAALSPHPVPASSLPPLLLLRQLRSTHHCTLDTAARKGSFSNGSVMNRRAETNPHDEVNAVSRNMFAFSR